MQLSEELRDKIRRRAQRAFEGEEVHRITGPTEAVPNVLHYRLPGYLTGRARRQGPKIVVRKDKIGRIYVPKEVTVG